MNDNSRIIQDFDKQWKAFPSNEGYYATTDLFYDLCGPLLKDEELENIKALDIGSGTGRIVNMLIGCGAKHVISVEPSASFPILQKNTEAHQDKITYMNIMGDQIPPMGDVDLAVSAGVIHHIPEPDSTVRAAFNALKPGGKFFVWLYGKEGNELYLSLFKPIYFITRRLPHPALSALSAFLTVFLTFYIWLCRFIPLPMHKYMRKVWAKFDFKTRKLTVYDQLNPTYTKYYSQAEAIDLLARNGFTNVQTYHRHGYSWSVVGTKP